MPRRHARGPRPDAAPPDAPDGPHAAHAPKARAPGGLDGLNPDDPGVRQLAAVAREVAPEDLLLVHCGELPGLRPGATRLILDVRERTGSAHHLVPDLGRDHAGAPLPVGDARFGLAAVWPRAHLGKDFSEASLAVAALALREGGELYCAVRKQKGGKSLAKTIGALLGTVEVVDRDRGYHLWKGVRGPDFNADLAHELSCLRYEIHDPALGELVLASQPGVFSRRELDGGTRALLAVASAIYDSDSDREAGPRVGRVVDLCAGVGPLGLWAASRKPRVKVLAIDSNLRACAMIRANAVANGLAERVEVCEHDGLPSLEAVSGWAPADLILLNPPTHADTDSLRRLLDLRAWLRPEGRVLLVVSRPHRALEILTELGAQIDGGERDGYFVIQAQWG